MLNRSVFIGILLSVVFILTFNNIHYNIFQSDESTFVSSDVKTESTKPNNNKYDTSGIISIKDSISNLFNGSHHQIDNINHVTKSSQPKVTNPVIKNEVEVKISDGFFNRLKKRSPGDFASFPIVDPAQIFEKIKTQPNQIKIKNEESFLQNSTFGKSSVSLSRAQCKSRYGVRTYLEDSERRLPPMLYTFPGSGNTWCRLLIEYTTGIYTGSVYNDDSLLQALPGEFTCNWKVSAVKVHPHTHPFEELRLGTFPSDNNKCKRGGIKGFQRAILLIRNPFDSIWSEYQRRLTQSHVKGIKKDGFDWHRWQANAAALSNSYYNMWHIHHMGIEKFFQRDDILYLKYEDLKNKETRIQTMKKVADFLRINSNNQQHKNIDFERLECAFILAESKQAHRSIDPNEKDSFMTKEIAYRQEIVCRMWKLFGGYASKHGYTPWANMDCTSKHFPPIQMINVGPQGEYNKKWVKPGGKLIDFRNITSPQNNNNNNNNNVIKLSQKETNLNHDNNENNSMKKLKSGMIKNKNFRKALRNRISPGSMDKDSLGMSINDAIKVTVTGKDSIGDTSPAWKK
eukprot:gene7781-10570_t